MSNSIFPITDKLFDYAGLFPPAQLSLENALQNYLEFKTHKHRQMLGKFVFPISKFEDLEKIVKTSSSVKNSLNSEKVEFTLLFSQSKTIDGISNSLQNDLLKIATLKELLPEL